MVNSVFLFVGIVLVSTGIISLFSFDGNSAYIPFGILCGLGIVFTILGGIGRIRELKTKKLNELILRTGVDAVGIVLFVDKNYTILLNHKPIYSIVEYKYEDSFGSEHVRRVSNLPSDLVIRNAITVGKSIPIKYLKEAPHQSVMII